jgi:hypothetical protein
MQVLCRGCRRAVAAGWQRCSRGSRGRGSWCVRMRIGHCGDGRGSWCGGTGLGVRECRIRRRRRRRSRRRGSGLVVDLEPLLPGWVYEVIVKVEMELRELGFF